jgi:hypothetical protein
MLALLHFCQWLSATPLSVSISESDWSFLIIETVHVIGTVLMVGTIAIVDLRLLGILLKGEPLTIAMRAILPLTWFGLLVMSVSGALLFISEAERGYYNPAFRIKLVVLAAAGLNALLFHRTIYRSVASWDTSRITPVQARRAAAVSLALWSAVVICGRAIAYYK